MKEKEEDNVLDLFMNLIAQAEASCEDDPAMHDAAAMVYVGDVYSLSVTQDQEDLPEAPPAPVDMPSFEVWPFIR